MSQAIIDFCEGLKTTLLGVEERLAGAKAELESGAAQASQEARKQIDQASAQLAAFRAEAARLAQETAANLPKSVQERTQAPRETLAAFGQEAQVALTHAAAMLADAASKGAVNAAGLLQKGANQADALAQKLRHHTAMTQCDTEPEDKQSS